MRLVLLLLLIANTCFAQIGYEKNELITELIITEISYEDKGDAVHYYYAYEFNGQVVDVDAIAFIEKGRVRSTVHKSPYSSALLDHLIDTAGGVLIDRQVIDGEAALVYAVDLLRIVYIITPDRELIVIKAVLL